MAAKRSGCSIGWLMAKDSSSRTLVPALPCEMMSYPQEEWCGWQTPRGCRGLTHVGCSPGRCVQAAVPLAGGPAAVPGVDAEPASSEGMYLGQRPHVVPGDVGGGGEALPPHAGLHPRDGRPEVAHRDGQAPADRVPECHSHAASEVNEVQSSSWKQTNGAPAPGTR